MDEMDENTLESEPECLALNIRQMWRLEGFERVNKFCFKKTYPELTLFSLR